MSETFKATYQPSLHWFAIAVAVCALGLIGMGGLVTSHGVGMAVPDWPTSYGYNMFALPFSIWLTGGVFHEHTHRLWASEVGLLTLILNCWLFGRKARWAAFALAILLILGSVSTLIRSQSWPAAAYFGVHGLGLLVASYLWLKGTPAAKQIRVLGIAASAVVIAQGVLGGLRVVLDAHLFAGTRLGVWFGVFHGCLGQVFLVLLAVIALMTSRWWMERRAPTRHESGHDRAGAPGAPIRWLVLGTTLLVLVQLLIGATMRHQHAGLAIPDFPTAYGAWWPDMSSEAVAAYNAARVEVAAQNPITAFQIGLQMAHRIMAALILVGVGLCFWRARPGIQRKLCGGWLGLVVIQAGLGMWTIWSNKAADIATLHVVLGALTLVTGSLITIIAFRFNFRCCGQRQFLASDAVLNGPVRPAVENQAQSAS